MPSLDKSLIVIHGERRKGVCSMYVFGYTAVLLHEGRMLFVIIDCACCTAVLSTTPRCCYAALLLCSSAAVCCTAVPGISLSFLLDRSLLLLVFHSWFTLPALSRFKMIKGVPVVQLSVLRRIYGDVVSLYFSHDFLRLLVRHILSKSDVLGKTTKPFTHLPSFPGGLPEVFEPEVFCIAGVFTS